MKKKYRFEFYIAIILLVTFCAFTLMVTQFDVKQIGPQGTSVGFSRLNNMILSYFGINLFWYNLTDWLGIVAIIFPFGFALKGIEQLIL
jgi:small neutral amino acid transporter SnatA (MarC family)